jgi:hypothetical protein
MRRRRTRPERDRAVPVWTVSLEDVLQDLDPDWERWHAVEDVRLVR